MGVGIIAMFLGGGWKVDVVSRSASTRDGLPAATSRALQAMGKSDDVSGLATYATLDEAPWSKIDIVVVSHGAAIRLVSAVLAGVDSAFAIDHHLANTESVVLAPITDGRWSCVQWGALTPPFATAPAVTQTPESARSADPMG